MIPRYALQQRGAPNSTTTTATASNGKGKGKGKGKAGGAVSLQQEPFPGTTSTYANHMRMEIVRELKVRPQNLVCGGGHLFWDYEGARGWGGSTLQRAVYHRMMVAYATLSR